MCKGRRYMYRLTGLPGWMRQGGPGQGCQHGPSRHGAMTREWGDEPSWTGPWGPSPVAEEERDFLRNRAELLSRHLDRIERRLTELGQFGA